MKPMDVNATPDATQDWFPGGATLLMSVYGKDKPALFQRALASALDGPVRPDAAVLVIDGPIDEGLERIVEAFSQRAEVQVLRLPTNLGLAGALNAGLQLVETAWVVRADADDVNTPDRWLLQGRFALANPEVSLFGGVICEVDPADSSIIAERAVPLTDADIRRGISARNPFNHMTVAFKVEPVRKVGGYPNLYLREDYGLWALLLQNGAIAANLPDVLVMATTGRDMYRRRGGLRYAMGEWKLQQHLVQCGIKSRARALLDGVLRAAVFLLPPAFRGMIYEVALRRRNN